MDGTCGRSRWQPGGDAHQQRVAPFAPETVVVGAAANSDHVVAKAEAEQLQVRLTQRTLHLSTNKNNQHRLTANTFTVLQAGLAQSTLLYNMPVCKCMLMASLKISKHFTEKN